jgi:hypothetical protein
MRRGLLAPCLAAALGLMNVAAAEPTAHQVLELTRLRFDLRKPPSAVPMTTPARHVSSGRFWIELPRTEMGFFFLQNLGVGGSVQFARADVSLPVANVTEVTTNVGGVQYGLGLRVRF